jgi:dipeptidyl aminopeptidase/acylaminoacyl peptidase
MKKSIRIHALVVPLCLLLAVVGTASVVRAASAVKAASAKGVDSRRSVLLVSDNGSTFELDPATGQIGRQIADGDDGVVSPNRTRVAYVRITDPCFGGAGPEESTTTSTVAGETTTSTAPEESTTTVPEESTTTVPEESTTTSTVAEETTTTTTVLEESTTSSTAPEESTTSSTVEETTTSTVAGETTTTTVAGETTTTAPEETTTTAATTTTFTQPGEVCWVAAADLLTADLAGAGERTIVASVDEGVGVGRSSPDWAPDGSRILFSWSDLPGEGFGLAWVRPDGSGLERLQPLAWRGTFSPDGKSIAYIDAVTRALHVMNLASRQTTALTTDGTGAGSGPDNPDWSPDGKRIAYTDFERGLYVVDAKTGQAVNLTEGWGAPLSGFDTPVYSPDGNEIAFVATDNSAYPEGEAVRRVYVVRASGGEPRAVAQHDGRLTDWLRL